jgi:L-lactate utilization protein LutC
MIMNAQTDKSRIKVLKRLRKSLAPEDSFTETNSVEIPPGNKFEGSPKRDQHLNLIPLLEETITKTGGVFHLARSKEDIAQYLIDLAKHVNAKIVIGDNSGLLKDLKLDEVFNKEGLQVIIDYPAASLGEDSGKTDTAWHQQVGEAALGITSVDHILADTGTVVIKCRPGFSRTLSLVPPIHVAIGEERQILPGLKDLFEQEANPNPASALIFTSGPSRTADIEQTLTVGVHGPIEFHLILLASNR